MRVLVILGLVFSFIAIAAAQDLTTNIKVQARGYCHPVACPCAANRAALSAQKRRVLITWKWSNMLAVVQPPISIPFDRSLRPG